MIPIYFYANLIAFFISINFILFFYFLSYFINDCNTHLYKYDAKNKKKNVYVHICGDTHTHIYIHVCVYIIYTYISKDIIKSIANI